MYFKALTFYFHTLVIYKKKVYDIDKEAKRRVISIPYYETQINSEDVYRKKLNKPLKKAAISPFSKGHIAQNQYLASISKCNCQ